MGGKSRFTSTKDFYIERFNNIKYKNSPFYKGAELWDLLPVEIASIDVNIEPTVIQLLKLFFYFLYVFVTRQNYLADISFVRQ